MKASFWGLLGLILLVIFVNYFCLQNLFKNFLVRIQIREKSSPLLVLEPMTYQVTVYEADDIPMCHRGSIFIEKKYFFEKHATNF